MLNQFVLVGKVSKIEKGEETMNIILQIDIPVEQKISCNIKENMIEKIEDIVNIDDLIALKGSIKMIEKNVVLEVERLSVLQKV